MQHNGLQNADEALADRITEKLVREGLVTASEQRGFRAKLVAGTAKARDWPAWILASASPEARAGKHG